MSDKEPEGVKCECGEFTPFNVWVYAHWNEVLTLTCPKCGKQYDVIRGKSRAKARTKNTGSSGG